MKDITVAELKQKLDNKEDFLLIDVAKCHCKTLNGKSWIYKSAKPTWRGSCMDRYGVVNQDRKDNI